MLSVHDLQRVIDRYICERVEYMLHVPSYVIVAGADYDRMMLYYRAVSLGNGDSPSPGYRAISYTSITGDSIKILRGPDWMHFGSMLFDEGYEEMPDQRLKRGFVDKVDHDMNQVLDEVMYGES